MGYYTHFELSVSGPSEFIAEFQLLADTEDPVWSEYNDKISDWAYGNDWDSRKWYGWKDDLASVSKQYPYLLFEITGEGEENGDIWHAWGRNGNVHVEKAKISWNTPDIDTILPPPKNIEDARKTLEENQAKRISLRLEIQELEDRLKKLSETA